LTEWEITAATIYCAAIDDEVTLLVHRDSQVSCTGQQRYQNPNRDDTRRLKERSDRAGRKLACFGISCATVTDYMDTISRGK
jgi:hypothetical protein